MTTHVLFSPEPVYFFDVSIIKPYVPDVSDFPPFFESEFEFITINETFYSYKLPDVISMQPDNQYEILIENSDYAEINSGQILFDLEGQAEGTHSFSIILKNPKGAKNKYFFPFAYKPADIEVLEPEPVLEKFERPTIQEDFYKGECSAEIVEISSQGRMSMKLSQQFYFFET